MNHGVLAERILQRNSIGSGVSIDSSYQAVLDRATALGYNKPSASQQVKQNALVVALKASGIWDLLDVFYVFANDGGQDFATLNWKSPSQFQCTRVNNPTFTSNQGFTGNGSTSSLNTNYNISTDGVNFTQDASSAGAWVNSIPTPNTHVFGLTASSPSLAVYVINLNIHRINTTNNLTGGSVDTTGLGYRAINRSSSVNCQIVVGNNSFARTATSAAKVNDTLHFLRAGTGFSNVQVSMGYAGGNMNTTQHNSFNSVFNSYMTSL